MQGATVQLGYAVTRQGHARKVTVSRRFDCRSALRPEHHNLTSTTIKTKKPSLKRN